MSIEDAILTLAHSMGRLADAINATNARIAGTVPDAAEKPKATKPKAEPKVEAPAAPVGNDAVMPAAKTDVIEQAQAALASAQQAEVPTYDSTRALMLQVLEKFGRDTAIEILGAAGLQDLKKGTAVQFVKVTAAALAKLA